MFITFRAFRPVLRQLSSIGRTWDRPGGYPSTADPQKRLRGSQPLAFATADREIAVDITVPRLRVTQVLALIVLFLTLASVIGQLSRYVLGHESLLGFVPLFSLAAEGNIPTWYASSILLLSSILLAIIALAMKRNGAGYVLHWSALSLIFLYLSLDEGASIHEGTITTLRSALNAGGFLYYTWVVPAGIAVLTLALLYLRFVASLPDNTRRLFVVAAAVFLAGALAIELVEGAWDSAYGEQNLTSEMIANLEESLEMIGVVIFIHALLSYMSLKIKGVGIRITDAEPKA